MMMLSVHIGTFLGPFVGAWTIDAVGYRGCWTTAALLTAAAAAGFVAASPARSVPEGAG
jgi:predicted MFS family arabinose efflux permease